MGTRNKKMLPWNETRSDGSYDPSDPKPEGPVAADIEAITITFLGHTIYQVGTPDKDGRREFASAFPPDKEGWRIMDVTEDVDFVDGSLCQIGDSVLPLFGVKVPWPSQPGQVPVDRQQMKVSFGDGDPRTVYFMDGFARQAEA